MGTRMHINIKKTHPDAPVPAYASKGAACFDLHAVTINGGRETGSWIDPGFPVTVGTGLAFEVPFGWVMLIYSRSGHGFKNDTRLANCVGVIDSDYRGEVMVKLTADANANSSDSMLVKIGDRIAQAMLVPVERIAFSVVDELSSTLRGEGGFGSTGAS